MNWLPGFGLVAPLGILGMLLGWPRRRELWLLYGMVGIYLLDNLILFSAAEYRAPAVPFLMVFAGLGLVKRPTRLGLSLLALGLAAAFVNWPRPDLDALASKKTGYANLAVAAGRAGRPELAEDYLAKANSTN